MTKHLRLISLINVLSNCNILSFCCAVSFMNCVESVLLLLGFNFPMDLEVKSGGFVDQKQSNITQKRAFGDYIAVTICI